MGKAVFFFFIVFLISASKASSQLRLMPVTDSGARTFSLRVLPQNFYSQHLGFVCKKEVQLQKLTRLPIYIRAGSKDYVDYLEQKPNAVWNNRQ